MVSGTDMAAPFGFTFGASHVQSHWSDFRHATWLELVELLTSHVPGQKEGECIVPAKFKGNRGDGFAYITSVDAVVDGTGAVTAPIVATVPGAAGNAAAGIGLTLGTAVTGITSAGTASTVITGGADQETDDDLRACMLFAYANPPAGGSQTDYVQWALAVPGVTRAWCTPCGVGAGTVLVQFMMDLAEAASGGFPQGVNGVAGAETRGAPAGGDQLTLANANWAASFDATINPL